jgi:hypothetical protein
MSGIGLPQNFGNLRQQVADDEVSGIKRDIFTDLLFDAFILVLIVHFGRATHCGIPIYKWTLIYFMLLGIRSIANLFKIYVVRNFFRY